MSDVANSPAPNAAQPPERVRPRRTAWIVALVVAAGLSGAAVTSAFSRGPGYGFGPGWHGGMMGGPFDPAQAEDRADRMVRHMAIELDATIRAAGQASRRREGGGEGLLPMREKAQAARLKARELLTQPTIDRAEIERFRTEQIALADAFTKRVAQAIGDAAEVLTPEQRRKLNDHLPPGAAGGPAVHWNRW